MITMSYNQIDHSHCWLEKIPACGQKIEHLKCCLCKLKNPVINAEVHKEILDALRYLNRELQDGIMDEELTKSAIRYLTNRAMDLERKQ